VRLSIKHDISDSVDLSSYSTVRNRTKFPMFLNRTRTEQEQYRLKIAVKTAGGVGYYYVEI
jgi:hypothetical protein